MGLLRIIAAHWLLQDRVDPMLDGNGKGMPGWS